MLATLSSFIVCYLQAYFTDVVFCCVLLCSNQIGGWSADGLTVDSSHSNENRVTCLTTHLTSFAVLVSIQNEGPVRNKVSV